MGARLGGGEADHGPELPVLLIGCDFQCREARVQVVVLGLLVYGGIGRLKKEKDRAVDQDDGQGGHGRIAEAHPAGERDDHHGRDFPSFSAPGRCRGT